ncbi:MAG TPA: hypothetical protein DDY31_13195 [Lachnospiraceae bacterium]|nr:hypothetical protein [Lachnospiraceae bacterium]
MFPARKKRERRKLLFTQKQAVFVIFQQKNMEIDKETLIFLLKYAKIENEDSLSQCIMTAKKAQVKKVHPYAITPPATEKGRWQTYYRDGDGKRKILRAQTEAVIIEKLFSIYFQQSNLDNLTFFDLYKEWLEYKKTITNSPNTVKRIEQYYKKYYQHCNLHTKKVRQISELFLEEECNRIVKEYNLTRKEWYNIRVILRGSFEYAYKKNYLSDNIMEKIKIYVKFKQVNKKSGRTETYNMEELKDLNMYLDRMYMETEDIVFLAVKLNFLLGLRVGELVALKWDDITDTIHLHITREEVRDQYTNAYSVVEHTKTNQDRFVVLVPKALEILKRIEHQGAYIFMRNGERLTSRQIAYVLEKYAQRQGVATKSTHKMRKTFASNLSANGVPLDCIREQLGHSSLSTTLGYIYNPLTEEETYKRITNALS